MANGDGRDASGKHQQVVAQVQGSRATFQFGTWLNIDTEPVDWSGKRHKQVRTEEAWKDHLEKERAIVHIVVILLMYSICLATHEVKHKS